MPVYFIQAGEGAVKVGYAKNPQRRLAGLQVGHQETLFLRAVAPGTGQDEQEFHGRFAAQRLRGEWFRVEGPVAEAMAAHAIPEPPPVVPGSFDASDNPLRAYLKAKRIRQSAFARKLGISDAYFCRILQGKRTLSLPLAARIVEAAGNCITWQQLLVFVSSPESGEAT